MTHLFRLASVIAGPLILAGCVTAATTITETHKLVSAEPIEIEFTTPTTPVPGIAPVFWSPATATATNNEKEYLGYLLIQSGQKCQEFADRLSTVQRGINTNFDILSGVLSALATALTPLSTVHALTAAATISTATKSAISADIYAKATASLILQQINNTYYTDIDSYRRDISTKDPSSIAPALEVSHIQAIHRECSLDAAIASLSQAGTATRVSAAAAAGAAEGARANPGNPTAGAIAGAAIGAAAGAGGPATAAPAEAAANQGKAAAAAVVTPPVAPPVPAFPGAAAPPAAPGGTGRRKSANLGSTGNVAPSRLDASKLTDQLEALLKDPKTGLATRERVDLALSCYPASLSKSTLPHHLLANRSGFAKEKTAIVDCMSAADLTDRFEALLKDPKTGLATRERVDLALSCYPASLSKSILPDQLLATRLGFAKEKRAIINCMQKT